MSTPFREPTLIHDSRVAVRGDAKVMRVQTYGERAGRDGRTDRIPGEVALCKRIGDCLMREFPGHPWAVEVNAEQGIASITIPPLLGMNWAYILHLDGDLDRRAIIKAGGEILERFRIPRSSIDLSAYVAAAERIPMLGNFRATKRHRALIPA